MTYSLRLEIQMEIWRRWGKESWYIFIQCSKPWREWKIDVKSCYSNYVWRGFWFLSPFSPNFSFLFCDLRWQFMLGAVLWYLAEVNKLWLDAVEIICKLNIIVHILLGKEMTTCYTTFFCTIQCFKNTILNCYYCYLFLNYFKLVTIIQ